VLNIADWLDDERVIEDIRRADVGLQSAPILVRNNAGGGRVAAITVTMSTALRLSAMSAIRVGMGMCRIKLFESKKARYFRCDELSHLQVSVRQSLWRESASDATNQATL